MAKAPIPCRDCGKPGARPYVVRWPLKKWMCGACASLHFKAVRRAALADIRREYRDITITAGLAEAHYIAIGAMMSYPAAGDVASCLHALTVQSVRYFADFDDQAHRAIPGKGDNGRATGHRTRAADRGAFALPYDVAWIRRLYDYRCAYCSTKGRSHHLDHVWPLVRGGDDAAWNVVPACSPCNLSKGPKVLAEWLPGRLAELKPSQHAAARDMWAEWAPR